MSTKIPENDAVVVTFHTNARCPRCAKLEAALRWYADPEVWTPATPLSFRATTTTRAAIHKGDIARKALEDIP